MEPVKTESWERFYDRVVAHGADWPRDLWFAAVGDAMAGAAPPGSDLASEFRRDVAELQALEHAGRGSYQDEQRIAQLEAQISRLITDADATIRRAKAPDPAAEPAPAVAAAAPPPEPAAPPLERGRRWSTVVGSIGLAVLLFGASLATAMHLYEQRLQAQVAKEVDRYVAEIQASIVRLDQDIAARLREARAQEERIARVQQELDSSAAEFSAMMTESLGTMMGLREAAVADLERQLNRRSGGVVDLLERLQRRAGALDRGLDEVSEDLAGLERALPDVSQSLARLGNQIGQGRAAFEEVSEQIAALKGVAPELATLVETERGTIERQLESHRAALGDLGARIGALRAEVEASSAELVGFGEVLRTGLDQAQTDGARLRATLDEMQEASEQAARLVERGDAQIAAMTGMMQERIDAVLSEMAEKADFALLRGDDVLKRAEARMINRIETAGEEAADGLAQIREQEIAALSRQIAQTRTELEQTRSGLVASWERMDRLVAERQSQLLNDLDRYAASMEERVNEFIAALNVMVVHSADGGG
jgi:chromosome segregation ATPase